MTFKQQQQKKPKQKQPLAKPSREQNLNYIYHAELRWDFRVICKLGQAACEISELGSDAF